MITASAPAAAAVRDFCANVHSPRETRATWPVRSTPVQAAGEQPVAAPVGAVSGASVTSAEGEYVNTVCPSSRETGPVCTRESRRVSV